MRRAKLFILLGSVVAVLLFLPLAGVRTSGAGALVFQVKGKLFERAGISLKDQTKISFFVFGENLPEVADGDVVIAYTGGGWDFTQVKAKTIKNGRAVRITTTPAIQKAVPGLAQPRKILPPAAPEDDGELVVSIPKRVVGVSKIPVIVEP